MDTALRSLRGQAQTQRCSSSSAARPLAPGCSRRLAEHAGAATESSRRSHHRLLLHAHAVHATATQLATTTSRSSSTPPSPRQSRPAPWLVEALPSMVRACSTGPSQLHVIRRSRATHAVELSSAAVPDAAQESAEYWAQCLLQASLAGAEGVVLVRPIVSPCTCCWRPGGCPDTYPSATAGPALGHTSSSTSTSTSSESSYNSSAAAQHHSAADSQGAEPATVWGAPPAASSSHSVTQPPGQQEQAGRQYDSPYAPSAGPGSGGGSSHRGFSAANAEYETTYYGMVVQGVPAPSSFASSLAIAADASASAGRSGAGLESRDGGEAGTAAAMAAVGGTAADLRQGSDGCFVLKLSRAPGADAGGACTHFTVTRVCQGQPLHDQLCGSWLTNAQKGA